MHRCLRITGKRQQPIIDCLKDHIAQAWLKKGYATLSQSLNPTFVNIHANNAVAYIGKDRSLHQAHIATSENTDSHSFSPQRSEYDPEGM